jgi:hypothetical protein
MAAVSNIRLAVSRASSSDFIIAVSYTALLSPFEASNGNFKCRDSFILWESDTGEMFGGEDDPITGAVGSGFFKGDAARIERRLTHRIAAEILNSEAGREELYVVVRLQNLDLGTRSELRSTIFNLSL